MGLPYHPFEGSLVRLRAREPEDVPSVHRWVNDPEIMRLIEVRYPSSMPQQRARAEDDAPPGWAATRFSIETLGGLLIGNCVLRAAAPEQRAANLGILIGNPDYWSRGYGREATWLLCRFGFEMMNLHRIELDVYEDNPRAIRCYEQLGFRHECRLRDANYRFGQYTDVLVMGLLRGELVAPGSAE
jgi:RimJ/RimL family protein N-acetyltransferase